MEYVIPTKYLQYNPFTAPECYNPTEDISHNKVRSLFISSDKSISPLILTDYSSVVLDTCFEDDEVKVLRCLNNYHIFYNPYLQWSVSSSNYIATMLVRNDQILLDGSLLTDSISGNVIIFGSINPITGVIDGNNYSVPYEIIEQASRIYETYI